MSRLLRRLSLILLFSQLFFPAATAQQIILSSANVIGGSAAYGVSTYNGGSYSATHVVNAQTGSITNDSSTNIWLGTDHATTGYFVLDLGAAYTLGQIDLFNTHNGGSNDRGTGMFHISASNSLSTFDANLGYDLVSASTILSGTLSYSSGSILTDSFTSANGLNTSTGYRYIRFTFDSLASSATGSSGPNGGGLNEIRVTAVPEPATTALAFAAAAVLAGLRRRRWSA